MLGEPLSMLVPQVVGFRADGRAAGGRNRDRPRPHRHRDPPPDRRRREVRRVLRARAGGAAARRPRHDREHVAGVRRHVRLLPGRRADAHVPPPDRAQRGADRARRGLLQGEHALARARRACDLLGGRRARPLDGRAEPRRAAPPAGPDPALAREDRLPRLAGHVRDRRDRPQQRQLGQGRRGHLPGERPDQGAGARSDPGAGAELGPGRPRDAAPPSRRRGGHRLRDRARQRRDHGDHVLHEHVEPAGDGRSGPAREEGGRAWPPAQAVGEVEPRAGLEGRHRVLRQGRPDAVSRAARVPHGRLRLHDLHRQLRPARRGDLGGRRPRATWSCAPCSRATGTSRRGSIRR